MNLTVRDLLKNFETLRTAYVKAWKNGFQDVCKKLRIELAEISEQLRALGVAVGMTEENLTYLKSSLGTLTRSATNDNTTISLTRDIENLFNLYTVEPSAPLSLLPQTPTRNCDILKERNQKC